MGASDTWAFDSIAYAHLTWLATPPGLLTLPGSVVVFHGTPMSDETYLLEPVDQDGAQPATKD